MKNTATNTKAVTPRKTSASSILQPCFAWEKLGQTLFSIALLIGLSIPFSLHAQNSGPRYGRSTVNGALYLLPNRDLSEGYFGSSVASGLRISCAPANLTAALGQTVTWVSSVTGGSGTYFYMWSGTESLFGNTSALQKTYTTRGEKSAILTVTSGTQQITVSCGSVVIGSPTGTSFGTAFMSAGFGASCYATPERAAPGESVTWLSIVSGTTASTTYSWDGTDGLTGDRPLVSKTYTTNGNKAALLTVTNGNERIVAACTNAVSVGPKITTTKPPVVSAPFASNPPAPLMAGLCAPSAASATTDDRIVWQAAAIGGTGIYRFTWKGDDALFSEGTTTLKQYETAGVKKVSVLITSGDKAVTINCAPIEITDGGNGLFAGAFLSWIDGPVGFILAAILAIVFGVFIALRKRSKEEAEEEEGDHVG